jgi:hypothetical protein
LGYIYNYTSAVTTVTGNTYTNSTAFTLPIGVYIVNAYCRFAPSTSSTYILNLGISTTVSTLSSFDYTILLVLTSSAVTHTINYRYILKVTSERTYYFVCNTTVSGSLNGTFNGQFLKIA